MRNVNIGAIPRFLGPNPSLTVNELPGHWAHQLAKLGTKFVQGIIADILRYIIALVQERAQLRPVHRVGIRRFAVLHKVSPLLPIWLKSKFSWLLSKLRHADWALVRDHWRKLVLPNTVQYKPKSIRLARGFPCNTCGQGVEGNWAFSTPTKFHFVYACFCMGPKACIRNVPPDALHVLDVRELVRDYRANRGALYRASVLYKEQTGQKTMNMSESDEIRKSVIAAYRAGEFTRPEGYNESQLCPGCRLPNFGGAVLCVPCRIERNPRYVPRGPGTMRYVPTNRIGGTPHWENI